MDWRRAARWPAPQPFSAFSTGIKLERQGPSVGVRAGDLKTPCAARPLHGRGHQSLVTPIDWKRCWKLRSLVESVVSPVVGDTY